MDEKTAFERIDEVIRKFRKKEYSPSGFNLSIQAKSDWLVFRYRKLYWKDGKLNYSIEIFPSFNSDEKIIGWNLVGWVYYDEKNSRFFLNKAIKENVSIDVIAENCFEYINQAYSFLSKIEKQNIPLSSN